MYDYSDSDFSRKTITIMELQALISKLGSFKKQAYQSSRNKISKINIEILTKRLTLITVVI